MHGKAVLALWLGVEPSVRDECDAWYANRHIADRAALPGWHRIRRFHGEPPTSPSTFALYEVGEPEQLVSDDYLRLQREVDETDRRMRAAFRDVARDTFRVVHTQGREEGGVVVTLRFAPDMDRYSEADVRGGLVDDFAPVLAAATGIVGVHILQSVPAWRARHDAHRKSGNQDRRVPWAILVEAMQPDRARAALEWFGKVKPDSRLSGLDVEAGIYSLMFAVDGMHP
jgi:hypothetical protein